MRITSGVAPIVVRTVVAGVAGLGLLTVGWKALGGRDPGSTLIAFPLMSFGATLVMLASGAGLLAFGRYRRGERLSPLPPDALPPVPLPRAVARLRR